MGLFHLNYDVAVKLKNPKSGKIRQCEMIQESESDSERDFAELERKLTLGRKRKVSCRNGWKLQSHVYGFTPIVTLTYLLLEQK